MRAWAPCSPADHISIEETTYRAQKATKLAHVDKCATQQEPAVQMQVSVQVKGGHLFEEHTKLAAGSHLASEPECLKLLQVLRFWLSNAA